MIRPTSNTEFNSGNSQNNLHVVTRHFPREYSTVPHVLALPRGQDYNGSPWLPYSLFSFPLLCELTSSAHRHVCRERAFGDDEAGDVQRLSPGQHRR
jgi:hypothetical protein